MSLIGYISVLNIYHNTFIKILGQFRVKPTSSLLTQFPKSSKTRRSSSLGCKTNDKYSFHSFIIGIKKLSNFFL